MPQIGERVRACVKKKMHKLNNPTAQASEHVLRYISWIPYRNQGAVNSLGDPTLPAWVPNVFFFLLL